MGAACEERLRAVPWSALAGVAAALDAPLEEVLAGASAERVLDRTLRCHRDLAAAARRAVAEAIFGVGLWRRRLAFHAGPDAPARVLLASLLRDLGGVADAERLVGLAPGALPPPRAAPAELGVRYSLPPWLFDTLRLEAGAEAEALADALDQPGPVCLRANTLRATPPELARRLAEEGVATRPGRLVPACLLVTSPRPNVHGLRTWRDGAFEVQDEGSQLVAALVEARPGDSVLDLCAGAGGKSLALAAAVGASGRVHATDADARRLERLGRRAERAGAAGIVRIHGSSVPPGLVADRALVDAPCSELGALRRGPDLRFRIDPASFSGLPPIQAALLARAAAHLREGGRLAYATCTFRREEDEAVAVAFERDHPGFVRVVPALSGAAATSEGFIRTWPHRHGCDGFFAAVWEKAR